MSHWKRHALALAATGIAALTLVGCSGNGGTPKSTTTTTVVVPASPSTSSSPSSSPSTSSTPSSSPSSGQGDTGGSVASGTLCSAAQLRGGIAPGSGGAAGSTYIHLTFTNTGTTTCVLQGWPGVSFVGDGNGTQIGLPATFDRSSAHPTVTLAPGGVAVAPLRVVNAANYPTASCDPTPADGFRVYPPGSKASLYIADPGLTACTASSAGLLDVQGIVANGAAVD